MDGRIAGTTVNIDQGGVCIGDSGAGFFTFNTSDKSSLSNNIVAVASAFPPDTTDPAMQFDYTCSNSQAFVVDLHNVFFR